MIRRQQDLSKEMFLYALTDTLSDLRHMMDAGSRIYMKEAGLTDNVERDT